MTVVFNRKILKMPDKNYWSSAETSVLLAIWSSSEMQDKLENTMQKKRVYDEISQEMQNGGFSRSSDQIMNKLKKLKQEYRELKRKPRSFGSKKKNKTLTHEVMASVLEPSSPDTEALDSNPGCAAADQQGSRQYWTKKETNTLLSIWSSAEYQDRYDNTVRKKEVYDDICQEMANAGFSRTTDQIMNKIKKLRKVLKDRKKDPDKDIKELCNESISTSLDSEPEDLASSNQFTEALNSATAMLEVKNEMLSSAAELDIDGLNQAESALTPTQPLPRKFLGKSRFTKKDSNQELLDYLQAADERFMAHAKELNTAILNKMDETTNSMLGLLGRMVTLMEAQQEAKP